MGLMQVASGIKYHIPIFCLIQMLIEIVRQQGLSEIHIVQRLTCLLLDIAPRCIHDLPRVRWQGVVSARLQVSLAHGLPCRVLDGVPAISDQCLAPPQSPLSLALLSPTLLGPSVRNFRYGIDQSLAIHALSALYHHRRFAPVAVIHSRA